MILTPKAISIFLVVFVFSLYNYGASNDYLMTIENMNRISTTQYEFEVWLKGNGSYLLVTSYQCSFKISPVNFNTNNLSFSYIPNSSQLSSLPPAYAIKVNKSGNEINLTFASAPGLEAVSPSAKRIGRFRITNPYEFGNEPLTIQWNFEKVMKTILTGIGFKNITQPSQHQYVGSGLVIQYKSGWNSLSIPLEMNNTSFKMLFPSAASYAYTYINNRITQADNLKCGTGYFVKFYSATTLKVNGVTAKTSVNISKGWNLIGPLHFNLSVNDIGTLPAGIVASNFFGADYKPAQTLKIGQGYWVKAARDGTLDLSGNSTGLLGKNPGDHLKEEINKIIIADAAGNIYTLYAVNNIADLNNFDLPPQPPDGMFDVRFDSQRFAENLNFPQVINISGAVYPVSISVNGMNIKLSDFINGSSINAELKDGESIELKNPVISKLKVQKISDAIPAQFILEQNYPNPFNPSTIIKFSIPEEGNVKLTVFNLLGQRVAELVNSFLKAGPHSYIWNASDMASGIYFYQLNSGRSSSVKKMILLK
ncbi:MAG TPA: T9SS type A sorting domain-containing protein [Ignavibacteriaceae bacterium]|nr:T9SS type A sorting domain-containing protein [Ignavibacteriaceae bacterium]